MADTLDAALATVHGAREEWARTPPAARRELLARCTAGLRAVARDWVAAACAAKDLDPAGPLAAEELAGGPVAVARLLLLWRDALGALARGALPTLPGRPRPRPDRLVEVPVAPTRLAFDRWTFRGHAARVVCGGEPLQAAPAPRPEVAVVLGAGNVSGIPPTDALTTLLRDGRSAVLKLNPLTDWLLPFLETAFAPLVGRGALAVVTGGAAAGERLAGDPRVAAVHLTGARATFRAVAAALRPGQALRAELGNVTPVVVLPGDWRARDVALQAEHVATMVVHNAGCNCVAARVLVTWREWDQRRRFLDAVDQALRRAPRRRAFYPDAAGRWAQLAQRAPLPGGEVAGVLVRDVDPAGAAPLLAEESFVPVLAEVALPAKDEGRFLFEATRFCNERLPGDLAAALLVPPAYRKRHLLTLHVCTDALRYGTVAWNAWPALAFAWMSPPWDAAPGNTVAEPRSGLGFVHDTFCLRDPRKTILDAPFRPRPKPVWFAGHRRARAALWALFDLWCAPSLSRAARAAWHAARP
jgi:acyl-CoA reductase-like NAD-dependent aldehyde dehydrogenase